MQGERKELRKQQLQEAIEWRIMQSEMYAALAELIGDSMMRSAEALEIQNAKVLQMKHSASQEALDVESARKFDWLPGVGSRLDRRLKEVERIYERVDAEEKLLKLMNQEYDRKVALLNQLQFRVKQLLPRVENAGKPELQKALEN